MSFEDEINAILGGNNTTQPERHRFEAINVGKNPFLGRILPLDDDKFPFVRYSQAWLNFENKDGRVVTLPVIFDRNDRNDELGHLINQVFFFNREQKNKGAKEDTIKISSGRFGLNIQNRVTFLGVRVGPNQNNQYVQETDGNSGQQVIKAFDMSYGMLRNVMELLRPAVPYMIDGQPAFNTVLQFINAQTTFPVSMQSKQGSDRRWTTSAQVIDRIILPPMSFNYLEKNSDGSYKYVPDIYQERRPLKESDPDFYQRMLTYTKDSVQLQMQKLGLTTLDTRNQTRSLDQAPQPKPVQNTRPQPAPNNQQPVQPQPSFNPNPSQGQPPFSNAPQTNDLPFQEEDSGLEASQSLDDFLSNL